LDTARARGPEAAERQIDAFIQRRAEQRLRENGRTASQDAATAREALWGSSVRRYKERQRRQSVAAWFGFYCRMADNHAALAEDYQRRAEELCEDQGS
jgi:hypothetical protein